MSFEDKQDTIRDKVLDLVKTHPEVLNDYRKLVHYYWYYVDNLRNFVPLDVLEQMTQPESICRALRKLVEDGDVSLPVRTHIGRREEEKRYRDYYGKQSKIIY